MAVITATNPPTVRAPTGYTHSMLITGEQRRLVISGQVGVAPDGSVRLPARARSLRHSQICARCWRRTV